MDSTAGRRKAHKAIESIENNSTTEYLHDVSMYKKCPENFIELSEFEEITVERLQVLRTIEEATLKGHTPFSEDWKQCIKQDLFKLGLKKYLRLISGHNGQKELDTQGRRADHLSHFLLRIAYCRSEDLRRWFLNREMELFKLRFLAQGPQGILKFLQLNNLTYNPISSQSKERLKSQLINSTAGLNERDFNSVDFYRIPWDEVLPLIRARRVFLRGGYAYIPTNELVVSVQAQFRAALSESLTVYSQRLPLLDDDRVNSLLSNLHNLYTGKTYVYEDSKEGAINPANIDAYSKQHFPLCMQHLYGALKTTHHLKHFGRLQLLLFLKGIGLSYEDAMIFWKSEFTKNPKIDENKFDKEYSYNVRHSFGKVGSMVNYSPYSCIKIIMNNVGQGDQHGCPFKHWDANILKHKLGEFGLGPQNVNSVMETVKGGHFQIACSKFFEYVNGQAPPNMISHPNQYFSDSFSLAKEKLEKKN